MSDRSYTKREVSEANQNEQNPKQDGNLKRKRNISNDIPEQQDSTFVDSKSLTNIIRSRHANLNMIIQKRVLVKDEQDYDYPNRSEISDYHNQDQDLSSTIKNEIMQSCTETDFVNKAEESSDLIDTNYASQSTQTFSLGHNGSINCMRLSSDHKYLLTSSYDGQIIKWNLNSQTIDQKYNIANGYPKYIEISESIDNKNINVNINLQNGKENEETQSNYDNKIDSHGKSLLQAASIGKIHIFDQVSGELLKKYDLDREFCLYAIDTHSNLLQASTKMNIMKQDLLTGSPLKLFDGYSLHLTCMTLTKNKSKNTDLNKTQHSLPQQYLYTGHHDHSVREWDTTTGVVTRTFAGHTGSVQYIAHSGDRLFTMQYAHSHGCNTRVLVWDLRSGDNYKYKRNVKTLSGDLGIVTFMQVSEDGQRLQLGQNECIEIQDTDSAALLTKVLGSKKEFSCMIPSKEDQIQVGYQRKDTAVEGEPKQDIVKLIVC